MRKSNKTKLTRRVTFGHVMVTCSGTHPLGSLGSHSASGQNVQLGLQGRPACGQGSLYKFGFSSSSPAIKRMTLQAACSDLGRRERGDSWCPASRGVGNQVQHSLKGPCFLFPAWKSFWGPREVSCWWERCWMLPRLGFSGASLGRRHVALGLDKP